MWCVMVLIASWNVNSITVRLESVVKWLAAIQPDILCLQETKITDEKFPATAFDQCGYRSLFVGQPAYNGVAVLSRYPLTKIENHIAVDGGGSSKRFIHASIEKLAIINTYVPNGQAIGVEKFIYKLNFLHAFKKYLSEECDPSRPLIWCGDFNIAPEAIDTYDDAITSGQIMCSDAERSVLKEIKDWGFTDTFRMHNLGPGHFTWWDYRMGAFRRNLGFRIDHIWTSTPLANVCVKAWIDKEPRKWERPSDHAPVLAEFNI